ncbi:Tyrosine-protein kinase-like otk [Araneus ventricosus]|uniref:Tyrosine-protein kinase-like otk n=1 Tax=Araneus ventricosus TaxID=182803 RepID=A0A4Y2N900_ARAVE|nr:Tyrosine-protein kinase-like otk [Araneus ventricosus]
MPKFSVQPSDTVANEGDPVILHCLAEGDPLPIIQWDKNNELNGFNHQRFKVLENGSLYATEINADDEGKYGCTAGNSGGLRRHEVSLIVKGPFLLGVHARRRPTLRAAATALINILPQILKDYTSI